ncbi:MAG: GYDIA family GHMP kinase [Bacteriovoracaceae bacterium]|nr:GYDIA family GHMP kinase [Bacteriovoracaceae bacterium]
MNLPLYSSNNNVAPISPVVGWGQNSFPKAYSPQISYYGRGKLLITGEYLLLHGAKSLSVPTKFGQSMEIRKRESQNPKLFWRSLDQKNQSWFTAVFDLWHFNRETENEANVDHQVANFLQNILKQARLLNPHFLRDEQDVFVETKLEFPISWGLGSSSSLVAMIAQWAHVGAFELHSRVSHGSGYDVATALAPGPISYQLTRGGEGDRSLPRPTWSLVPFAPVCMKQIFFVYQGSKQDTQKELVKFMQKDFSPALITQKVNEISQITEELMVAERVEDFQSLIKSHDEIMSDFLKRPRLKLERFADFFGEIKPLGAWGGDFCLVVSNGSEVETKKYFESKDLSIVISFEEMVAYQMDGLSAGRLH